ncbi:MAG: hypothetical protein B7Z20_13550, partial [Sphingobium sp. 32-64-5]
MRGGAGADVFRFAFLNLRGDVIAGGAGSDTLLLTGAGGLPSNALRSMTGVERVLLAADGNAITLENANFTGVAGAKITVIGGAGAGANTVNASALTGTNAIDVTAGGGLDVLRGGAGNDVFRFRAGDLAGDTVIGGNAVTSIDTLIITTAGALAADALANVTGVETFRLAAGGNGITLLAANFANTSGVITVIGSDSSDTVDASALTSLSAINANAGGGDDVFRFSSGNLTAADTVQGGSGIDRIVITTAGTLATDAFANVSGIEQLDLAAGGNSLILTDAVLAAPLFYSDYIDIIGSTGASVIDASRLSGANAIHVRDGGGIDTIT